MKIKISFALLTLFVALSLNEVHAQWALNGNNVAPGQFFGSTNNQDLNFHTSNAIRMRMRRTTGSQLVNNQSVDLSGNLAIGQNLSPSLLPLARLHIIGGGSVPLVDGYRSWMAYGVAFSVDGLDMYVGPGKFSVCKI